MFSELEGSRKAIGDVDVVYHEGLYHLFHLVLPNHDFIAHAVSDNGLNWRRVDNALFIGHPGSWDDLMLWTMHVTADPHDPGRWRMFYTGLSRKDRGLTQRIGMAHSNDLYRWQKCPVNWEDTRGAADPPLVKQARAKLGPRNCSNIDSTIASDSHFPLAPDPAHYEASLCERNWISFRDPFFYRDEPSGEGWLLMAARENQGPLVRRGCVGVMKESNPNQFVALPPLHAPQIYDDIEVPNLMKMDGEYYLIGSIREDAKIRYWHTTQIDAPWRNYYDNVVLPQGNYAGRICRDPHGMLLWNFYTQNLNDRTAHNILPPPKRLCRRENGQLRATTFTPVIDRVQSRMKPQSIRPLKHGQQEDHHRADDGTLRLVSDAGFQAFTFESERVSCFRLSASLRMNGSGKCGLLYRIDPATHDGYYVSLDLLKGIAQFRCWGTGPVRSGEDMMRFQSRQAGYWYTDSRHTIDVQLIAFGSYHELSIDDSIVLSLVDATFDEGLLGIYVETADLTVSDLVVDLLEPPTQSDEHLTSG